MSGSRSNNPAPIAATDTDEDWIHAGHEQASEEDSSLNQSPHSRDSTSANAGDGTAIGDLTDFEDLGDDTTFSKDATDEEAKEEDIALLVDGNNIPINANPCDWKETAEKIVLLAAAGIPPMTTTVNAFCAFPHFSAATLTPEKIRELSPGILTLSIITGLCSYPVNAILNYGTIRKASTMFRRRIWNEFSEHPYANAAALTFALGAGVSAAAVGYASFLPFGVPFAWANFTTNGFIFFVTRFFGLINALNRFEKWKSHNFEDNPLTGRGFDELLSHATPDCAEGLEEFLRNYASARKEAVRNLLERVRALNINNPSIDDINKLSREYNILAEANSASAGAKLVVELLEKIRNLKTNNDPSVNNLEKFLQDYANTETDEDSVVALLTRLHALKERDPTLIEDKSKRELLAIFFDVTVGVCAGLSVLPAFAQKFLDGLDQLKALFTNETTSSTINELAIGWRVLLSSLSIATSILYTGQVSLARQTGIDAYESIRESIADEHLPRRQKIKKVATAVGLGVANAFACVSVFNVSEGANAETHSISRELVTPGTSGATVLHVAAATGAFGVNGKLSFAEGFPSSEKSVHPTIPRVESRRDMQRIEATSKPLVIPGTLTENDQDIDEDEHEQREKVDMPLTSAIRDNHFETVAAESKEAPQTQAAAPKHHPKVDAHIRHLREHTLLNPSLHKLHQLHAKPLFAAVSVQQPAALGQSHEETKLSDPLLPPSLIRSTS